MPPNQALVGFNEEMDTVNAAASAIDAAVTKVLSIINGPNPVWTGTAADDWNNQFKQWASSWQRLYAALPDQQSAIRQALVRKHTTTGPF